MLHRPAPVYRALRYLAPLDAGVIDRKALAAGSQRMIEVAPGRVVWLG